MPPAEGCLGPSVRECWGEHTALHEVGMGRALGTSQAAAAELGSPARLLTPAHAFGVQRSRFPSCCSCGSFPRDRFTPGSWSTTRLLAAALGKLRQQCRPSTLLWGAFPEGGPNSPGEQTDGSCTIGFFAKFRLRLKFSRILQLLFEHLLYPFETKQFCQEPSVFFYTLETPWS